MIDSVSKPHNRVMGGSRDERPGVFTGPAAIYALPDPELRAYDHGLGTLRVDGELRGYLASVVGEMRFPSRGPWLWFVVVWTDGTKENSFEDYGPSWWAVRELDAGYLDHYGPSVPAERRLLWWRIKGSVRGPSCLFDFEWLRPDVAETKWRELGLVDSDF